MSVLENPIEIVWPTDWRTPFVFSSPHSGSIYPEEFVESSALGRTELRQSEDFLVDELFVDAPAYGAPLLRALFPRSYCDVNREAYELDPHMFRGPLPEYVTSNGPRVACGIGTIPRIVGAGKEIYRQKLDFDEIHTRIQACYFPYHYALQHLIDEGLKRFGVLYLIDCHSMPPGNNAGAPGGRPDMILGNRYGTSCDGTHFKSTLRALASYGYDIGQNAPYAGGFITSYYGNPEKNVHSLQIEINRNLYMHQKTMTPSVGFERLQQHLGYFIDEITHNDSSLLSA